MRLFGSLLGVILVACSLALPIAAQETTGTIAGLVSDASGGVVAPAEPGHPEVVDDLGIFPSRFVRFAVDGD